MKHLRTLLKIPKLAIALTLLLFFYLVETILMIVYVVIEYPLSFMLNKVEAVIKYLVKNI
jgi:hypothetical protein